MYQISKEDFFKILNELVAQNVSHVAFSNHFGLNKFIKAFYLNAPFKSLILIQTDLLGVNDIDIVFIHLLNDKRWLYNNENSIFRFHFIAAARELKLLHFS